MSVVELEENRKGNVFAHIEYTNNNSNFYFIPFVFAAFFLVLVIQCQIYPSID